MPAVETAAIDPGDPIPAPPTSWFRRENVMRTLPIVVVYLADPRRALELVQLLENHGCQAVVATASDELYEVVNRERVDLVIVEQRLRGFLSGLEILERLFNDLLRPATILLADQLADLERRAKKLGVNRLLSTQTPLAEVAATAGELVRHSALKQLNISPVARRLVRDTDCVRPLPQLLIKLAGSLREAKLAPDQLARDISVDGRITAELLRLANSSALGRAHKTTNLPDAVNFLGVKRTVSLVLSAGLIRAKSNLLGSLSPQTRTWYNYRSVLIGSIASAFARNLEGISSETAYILGLLQDVGILVLGHAHGEHYLSLLDRVREIPLLRLEHLEHEDFGTNHAEVSAALLQKWGLPDSLVSMVLDHHHETGEDQSELERSFSRVMRIGEAVANLADRRSPQRYLTLNRLLYHYGVERAEECRASMAEGIARMVESSELFSVPLPSEEALDDLLQEINTHARYDDPTPPPAAPPSPSAPRPVLNQTSPRPAILVIEDEWQVVKLIRLFVAPLGVEVLSCSGLAEARQLAPQAELIFCDVHLGGENGIDVIRQLRKDGYAGPVLIVSGDRYRGTVQQSIEAGINGYLIKPFSKALLLEKIKQHLPESRLSRYATPAILN